MLVSYFLEQPGVMSVVEEDLPLELKGCQLSPCPQMDLLQREAGPQLSPECSSLECRSYGDSPPRRQKGLLPPLRLLFVGELGAYVGSDQTG